VSKATTLIEELYKKNCLARWAGEWVTMEQSCQHQLYWGTRVDRPVTRHKHRQWWCGSGGTRSTSECHSLSLSLHDERVTTHSGRHCRCYCMWADQNTHVAGRCFMDTSAVLTTYFHGRFQNCGKRLLGSSRLSLQIEHLASHWTNCREILYLIILY
jgi:hypothetical protein